MIESISIKNVASFDSTGVRIDDLKKVNFIYGTNGCGKTTISNFLHNPTDLKFTDCSATWKNAVELKTLVYRNLENVILAKEKLEVFLHLEKQLQKM